MIYDLATNEGIERCKKRLNALVKKQAKAEVTEATDAGSDQQRKYFHSMLQVVARDRGYEFEDFKEAIIIHLGYYQEILGEKVRDKTSKMNKKVYSMLISDFMMWSEVEGFAMPTQEQWEERGE